ncbi:MAG: hypothetical protein ACI9K2_006729, partial [Myxococcota bacterium]
SRALGWGPWEGGMVTPALKARFESLGVPLIPLDVGAKMLVDECRTSVAAGGTEVVLGGEPRMQALAEGARPRGVRLAVHAARASHGFLADHTIAGVPVVPVVLAIEWFARAARACRPTLHLTRIRDVKVLSGVKLDAFDSGSWLYVDARELSNGSGSVLAVELRGADGRAHYRATAEMDSREPAKGPALPNLKLQPWRDDAIYDGHVLFHGRTFQVIQDLQGIGDDGIAATLATTVAAGWGDERWLTDPAALDGGLQLALLWARRVLGGATLPMGVGAWDRYAEPAPGPLTAVLRGERVSREKARVDVLFRDSLGRTVAGLRGVELILRPGEAPTAQPRA